jgi:hypothetical protein
MAILSLAVSIADPVVLLDLGFDRIAIYRSTNSMDGITGTFTELTTAPTRLVIDQTQRFYRYIDATGELNYWYRVQYVNSVSGANSTPEDAFRGTLATTDILTIDELRDNYLFGLPLTDNYGNEYPDSFYRYYIEAAVAYIERRLDVRLTPTVITDEKHPFYRQDYNKFIYLQLYNKPLHSVQEVRMVLPTETRIITFSNTWVRPDYDAATIEVVPGTGSITAVALGLSSLWAPIINGMMDYVPDILRVDYTAGYRRGQVPRDIVELIGKVASMGPLAIIGDLLLGPGVSGSTVTLDALMTNVRSTKESGQTAFSGRIKQYREDIRNDIREMRRTIHGIRMVLG